MGFFKPKNNLALHSKMKGMNETITKQPKGMSDNEFITWAKSEIALVSIYRIEWYYIVNEKTGEFVYDFSKN